MDGESTVGRLKAEDILKIELEYFPETFWQAKMQHDLLYGLAVEHPGADAIGERYVEAAGILVNTLFRKTEEFRDILSRKDYKRHSWYGRLWDLRKAYREYRNIRDYTVPRLRALAEEAFALDGREEWEDIESLAKDIYERVIEELKERGSRKGIRAALADIVGRGPAQARHWALKLAEEYDLLFGGARMREVDLYFCRSLGLIQE